MDNGGNTRWSELTIKVLHQCQKIVPDMHNGIATSTNGVSDAGLIPSIGAREKMMFMNGAFEESKYFIVDLLGKVPAELESTANQIGAMIQDLNENDIVSDNNHFKFKWADVTTNPQFMQSYDGVLLECQLGFKLRIINFNN